MNTLYMHVSFTLHTCIHTSYLKCYSYYSLSQEFNMLLSHSTALHYDWKGKKGERNSYQADTKNMTCYFRGTKFKISPNFTFLALVMKINSTKIVAMPYLFACPHGQVYSIIYFWRGSFTKIFVMKVQFCVKRKNLVPQK